MAFLVKTNKDGTTPLLNDQLPHNRGRGEVGQCQTYPSSIFLAFGICQILTENMLPGQKSQFFHHCIFCYKYDLRKFNQSFGPSDRPLAAPCSTRTSAPAPDHLADLVLKVGPPCKLTKILEHKFTEATLQTTAPFRTIPELSPN